MNARDAFVLLRAAAVAGSLPNTVTDAIGVALDHVTRLEQALDLISTSVNSALQDKPPNAVIGVSYFKPPTKPTKKRK